MMENVFERTQYVKDQTILHFLMEVLMRTANFNCKNHQIQHFEQILFNEMCFHFVKLLFKYSVFQLELGK